MLLAEEARVRESVAARLVAEQVREMGGESCTSVLYNLCVLFVRHLHVCIHVDVSK